MCVDDEASGICQALLGGSGSLRCLRLDDVGLDDGGAAALAMSLPPALEELHLGGGGVGPRATAALAAALASDAHPALWNVSMPGTAVGAAAALELDAALTRRQASGCGEADITTHVIEMHLNHRLLSYRASYDVAINMRQALRAGTRCSCGWA